MSLTAEQIADLVTEGSALDLELREKKDRLIQIRKTLAENLEAGDYAGRDGTKAKVIVPGPAIKPDEKAIGQIRATIGETDFKTLFFRVVQWKPEKDIRAKAEVLLPPAKHRKFLELAEVETTPYVIFS